MAWVIGLHLGETRCVLDVAPVSGGWIRRHVEIQPDDALADLSGRLVDGSDWDEPALGQLDLTGLAHGAGPSTPSPGPGAPLLVQAVHEGTLTLRISCDGRVVDEWLAGRILEHLRRLLEHVVEFPGARLEDLPLLSPEDRALLGSWNRTGSDERAEACVHTLFEEHAAARPDAVAVISAEGVLRYGDLDRRANKIAHHLVALGVAPGMTVGVCLERSLDVPAALLGILKAGAAYLPLDPTYPQDRLAFMLSDTQAPVVITRSALAGALPEHGGRALLLDRDAAQIEARPEARLARKGTSSDLAYVMYTSGSTGTPKGVEIVHRAITRLVQGVDYATLGPGKTLLHAAPLAFDASTFEIWGALLNGGRCVIHPEALPTARGLGESIRQHGVTTMWLTAALFNATVDDDPAQLLGLEELLTGGEALSVDHVRRAGAALPSTQLVNGYGPTESTTFTTCHRIPRDLDPALRSIPIGRPIRDTTLHVLDRKMALLPIGAVGELFIGGEGLARGYLRRPELTAERFVTAAPAGLSERLYRTGDLVRWRQDGTLEFLGRRDDQVKIRGFRIELGEVEAAVKAHPAVQRCTVLAREDVPGQKRLVAYAVAVPGTEAPSRRAMKEFLERSLPLHMVPSEIVWLATLPINANGKVDRRALPAPRADRPDLGAEAVAPSTDLERRILDVFSDVLGMAGLGVRDSFFDLGGNSLLALRTAARLQQVGLDVPVTRLFQHTTVEALARHFEDAPRAPPASAPRPAATDRRGRDVAVVGMAGRFPGASSVEQLWENVRAGVDSITFFTESDLDPTIPAEQRDDPAYVKARGIVEGSELFDAAFFGISPKEAEAMDPQQRLLLEVSWEALERAGHAPDTFPGDIGIFAGKYFDFYWDENVRAHPEVVLQLGDLNSRIANDKHFVATRVAHRLNLTGPAISVHSACSTSLVAICQAVQSLRNGECDLALAGGASLTVPIRSGYLYQEGSMLSPDGHTRTFDAKASGTTFSDGVAMVVLRRLQDALADGDTIHAVIRGVAVNNDGAHRASFTAPSVDGQAAVVLRALADGGVEPRSVSYVETHGTATPLGDPIEVEALTRAYRTATADRGFCSIGSVKSNVGHLVIAAGATGLIKTAYSLRERTLAPTAHFVSPNPGIDFERSPFRVQARLEPWPEGPTPRRAGVSAFGVGGTNAHVVMEEPGAAPPSGPAREKQLLLLSARTSAALDAATARLREHLRANPTVNLADVAFTLQAGRQPFANRRFLVCDAADAVAGLDPAARRTVTGKQAGREPKVIFMFPGQGSQHVDMGRNLYREEPVFRAAVDRCAAALEGVMGRDLREVLYPQGDPAAAAEELRQTATTQPALFTISYALACLWQSWGVRPSGMIGHSVGEFVCAALAGVLSVEEAARLVAARGRLMQDLPAGSMLSVSVPAGTIGERLTSFPTLAVASENAPQLCVVSGPAEDVARLQRELEAAEVGCRPLVTSHAFHSPMMDSVVEPFAALVRQVRLQAPRIPFVSTVTGTWITPEQATDPMYWARHLRETVRFAVGVKTLLEEPNRVLLEAGPRATLTAMARRQVKDLAKQPVIASQSDTSEGLADESALLAAAGQLWMAGVSLDWNAIHRGERRQRVVLPTYPFERKRFWLDAVPRAATPAPAAVPPLPAAAQPPPPPLPMTSPPLAAALASSLPLTPTMPEQPMTGTNHTAATRGRRLTALKEMFEEVTGLELADADPGASFVDLGLDSLFLTQAALQVHKRFGVKVTFRQMMESFTSLDALATHLDEQLPPEAAPAEPAPAPAAAAAAAPPAPAQGFAVPAPSFPVLSGAPAGSGIVQAVIDQQLRLMAAQLALLTGGAPVAAATLAAAPVAAAAATVAAPPPAPAPSAPAARTEAPPAAAAAAQTAIGALEDLGPNGQNKYDVKKAFGAIAKITTHHTELTPKQRSRLDALARRYNTRTKESKRLTQANRGVLADPRVVTGFKPMTKELTYQIIVERSKGSHLWDVDGNEYVDALCGFGACFFGWQPDFVTEAVKRQLDLGHEIGPMTPLAGEVARLLCDMTGFDRAGFCNTGSEAVMGAMRVARTVTGRSTIVTFTGAYHGIFDEVIVRGTKKLKAIPAAPGILPSTSQNVLVLDYGTPESLEVIRSRADELAAVLVEPIQSRRPDFRPREFLQEVRAITEKAGAALIFDEVVNGFRTGPGGAQEYYGIKADLGTYGKVVGGGFPIGIIAGKKQWADALDGGFWQFGDASVPTVGVTYFAGTFCRHPLALASAKAVLEHLKEKGPALQEWMNARTQRMIDELNAHFATVKAPVLMKGFASLWKATFTEELPLNDLLFVYLRDRGVHILEGFPCFLTTAHTDADIAFIVKAFKDSVAEMQEAGFFPEAPPAARVDDPSSPPVPGARLGRDPSGAPTWYIPDPAAPGKYVRMEAE